MSRSNHVDHEHQGDNVHLLTTSPQRPIIVGVEDTDAARTAARRAADLAADSGRPLHLVHALDRRTVVEVARIGSDQYVVDLRQVAEDMLRNLAADLHGPTSISTAVGIGRPAAVLCAEARAVDAELIVLGNRQVQRRLPTWRSIAAQVARRAPCDVDIVRTHAGAAPVALQFA